MYLLIVSTNPYVVLLRKGFALRNIHPYEEYVEGQSRIVENEDGTKTLPLDSYITHTTFQKKHENFTYPDHWWTFDKVEEYFGPENSEKIITGLKKIASIVTDILEGHNPKERGLYYFLAIDSIIRSDFSAQMLEMNTIPYLGILPDMVESRQREDFKLVNEILHIVYSFETHSRNPERDFQAKKLELSPDWHLIRNDYNQPEFRAAPKTDCKTPKTDKKFQTEL